MSAAHWATSMALCSTHQVLNSKSLTASVRFAKALCIQRIYMSLNIKFLQGLGARVSARKGLSYRLIRMLRQIAEGFGQGIQLAPNINGDAGETVKGLDCVGASEYQHPVANNPTAVAVATGRWASNAAELVPPVKFWLQIPRHVSIIYSPQEDSPFALFAAVQDSSKLFNTRAAGGSCFHRKERPTWQKPTSRFEAEIAIFTRNKFKHCSKLSWSATPWLPSCKDNAPVLRFMGYRIRHTSIYLDYLRILYCNDHLKDTVLRR